MLQYWSLPTIFQCLGNYLLFLLTSRSLRPSVGLDFDIVGSAMQYALSIKNDASLEICIRFSIKFLHVVDSRYVKSTPFFYLP